MRCIGLGIVFVLPCLLAPAARAGCRLPSDPTVICGAGQTVVIALAQDDGLRIEHVAGAEIDGVEVDALVDLAPAESATEHPGSARSFFILRDATTYVLAAPVEGGRVVFAFGEYSYELNDAIALALEPDRESCAEDSFTIAEPPVPRREDLTCNDDQVVFGCTFTSTSMTSTALGALLLLLRRRRSR